MSNDVKDNIWPFTILGIGITRDKKRIKRAYATLLHQRHPEDDPTGFQQLHEAYQAALRWDESTQTTQITHQTTHQGSLSSCTHLFNSLARFDCATPDEWQDFRSSREGVDINYPNASSLHLNMINPRSIPTRINPLIMKRLRENGLFRESREYSPDRRSVGMDRARREE